MQTNHSQDFNRLSDMALEVLPKNTNLENRVYVFQDKQFVFHLMLSDLLIVKNLIEPRN